MIRGFALTMSERGQKDTAPNWSLHPHALLHSRPLIFYVLFPHSQIRPWSSVYYEQEQRELSDVSVKALDLVVNYAMTLDTHSPTSPLHHDSLAYVPFSRVFQIIYCASQFADPFLYQTLLDLSLPTECFIFSTPSSSPILTHRRTKETNANVFGSGHLHSSFDLAGTYMTPNSPNSYSAYDTQDRSSLFFGP